jgi:hypothetical protein
MESGVKFEDRTKKQAEVKARNSSANDEKTALQEETDESDTMHGIWTAGGPRLWRSGQTCPSGQ